MKNLVKHLPEAVAKQGGCLQYVDNYLGGLFKGTLWVGSVVSLRFSLYCGYGCCWPSTDEDR